MTAPTATTLRMGTRASLLARAQSILVAREIEHAHPHVQVELVEFSSRGDKDQSTPLTDVNDIDFFSDELDAALARGEIDFCVHSWKDIDGPRPANFVRAAVPRRALPHDVILFRGDINARLQDGKVLRIGTCSRRRQLNCADFLRTALPRPANNPDREPQLQFLPLRGPVHERVRRIDEAAGDDRLDGIVLALAGLARLWQDPQGRAAIEPYMSQARQMVLPLSQVPAAPAQGALAVETRVDHAECRELLRAIHDPASEERVQIEQALIHRYDTSPDRSCGASAVADPQLGFVARLRGRTAEGGILEITRTEQDQPRPAEVRSWQGDAWRKQVRKTTIDGAAQTATDQASAVFIAHADALPRDATASTARCWTSGPESWARLARAGVWVEGCADNLGFQSVKELLAEPVLQLPPLREWVALTHRDAVAGWRDSGIGAAAATYSIDIKLDEEQLRDELGNCTHFYWSSARQYLALRAYLPANASHACGAGKTLHALRTAGLENVRPFPSRREWQRWAA